MVVDHRTARQGFRMMKVGTSIRMDVQDLTTQFELTFWHAFCAEGITD